MSINGERYPTYLGAWKTLDGHRRELNVCIIVESLAKALECARENDQEAIYDVQNSQPLRV